jgi:hypothetical protein
LDVYDDHHRTAAGAALLVSIWPWRTTTGGGHTVAHNAFVEVAAPIERIPGPQPDSLTGNA